VAVRIVHRDLEKEDYGECLDANFFADDYTVAAATVSCSLFASQFLALDCWMVAGDVCCR
jgi:hypothetical protein